MKKLLLVLLFVPLVSFGQTKEELQLCLAAQSSNFTSDSEADNALDRILNVIGASKNFVLTPCSEINNAMATSYKGIRYILYDKAFMKLINSRTNDWASLAILAHEVGHHINGHTLDLTMYAGGVVEAKSLAVKRKQELEADEFAGFILARLGATSDEALAFTEVFQEKDDTYDTHPSKSKRVASVTKGYTKATTDYNYSAINKAEEFFYKGVVSEKSNKLYEAFGFYTKSIKLNTSISEAYNQRAKLYMSLFEDIPAAIQDITKAIELDPINEDYYFNRSLFHKRNEDLQSWYDDISVVIDMNPNDEPSLFNRGVFLLQNDFILEAVSDFDRVIELNANNAEAYYSRGLAKLSIEGKRDEACVDAKKSLSLGRTESQEFLDVMCEN